MGIFFGVIIAALAAFGFYQWERDRSHVEEGRREVKKTLESKSAEKRKEIAVELKHLQKADEVRKEKAYAACADFKKKQTKKNKKKCIDAIKGLGSELK